MDAFRQSVLRAHMGKPLPVGAHGKSPKAAHDRVPDMAFIGAHFAALDRKLDTVIRMSEEDFDRHGRADDIARIRQIAFYLCRTRTPRSLVDIGRVFGRNHTTIRHGVGRIRALRSTDAALDDNLRKLEAQLTEILARRMTA
jgi:hypothetical protein